MEYYHKQGPLIQLLGGTNITRQAHLHRLYERQWV